MSSPRAQTRILRILADLGEGRDTAPVANELVAQWLDFQTQLLAEAGVAHGVETSDLVGLTSDDSIGDTEVIAVLAFAHWLYVTYLK